MKLSSLPRSLAAIRTAVRSSGTGVAMTILGPRASVQEQQQGTRASQSQGTSSSSNTPNPLVPGGSNTPNRPRGWDDLIESNISVFSTDAPVYGGTAGTIIQTRDWPPNPSMSIIAPSSGHREQLRTDAAIQLGPGPGRIERKMPLRIYGVDNAATGMRGTEQSYGGSIADHDFIEHVKVARQALGTKGPQKLSDDNAVVPAVYAGNPR